MPRSRKDALDKTDKASCERSEQLWRVEATGSALGDFRKGGVRQRRAGDRPDLQARRNGQTPGADQFTGVRSDNRGTKDPSSSAQNDLCKTCCLPLCLGAVIQ